MAIFHMLDMSLPKWASAKVDRITHDFVWYDGDSETAGCGHSLVNLKTVCRAKVVGDLGIVDLERFGRALGLRWP